MLIADTAALFPGQGPHCSNMLDGVRHHSAYDRRYSTVCSLLGFDPVARINSGQVSLVNENAVSSLLTILASSIALDMWKEKNEARFVALAGYSVGLWTALYASEAISFKTLTQVVFDRASFMDQCASRIPGAMLGVIGVSSNQLEALCCQIRDRGEYLVISNYNCVGQYTLSGSPEAIEVALPELQKLNPKKLSKLNTSGAWHCAFMDNAAEQFRAYLRDVDIKETNTPVIDTNTGKFLSSDRDKLLDSLSFQLNHPVYWELGIHYLISKGIKHFIEIGFGSMLTKFGFFIERSSVKHKTFYPYRERISGCAE